MKYRGCIMTMTMASLTPRSGVENTPIKSKNQNKTSIAKAMKKSQTSSIESRIKRLETSMNKAGAKSIPYYRKLKTLKTTGKGIWNKKISLAAKEAKSAHRKWKDKKNCRCKVRLC
jgi:uncharacterized protein (UPF0248 family)